MKCPHCAVTVDVNWISGVIPRGAGGPTITEGIWGWEAADCPNCKEAIIKIGYYQYVIEESVGRGRRPMLGNLIRNGRIVWPRFAQREPGNDVPEVLKADYLEACEVLPISPKASAALSRRVLQAILREQGYASRDLARQIDDVLSETHSDKVLPTSLRENVDVIRKFGNFSAHPVTDTTSLQIIDVEPQEAEWCLEIVERLFDHYYVRPAADARRLVEFNKRLQQAGQPPTKS